MRRSGLMRGSVGRLGSPDARALAALQPALAAEQAASYGYGVAGAHLTGARYTEAVSDWIAHQRARDDLENLISGFGGQAVPAAAAYQLPVAVRTAAHAISLAIILEQQVTAAYLGMVALPDSQLRLYAAGQMQAAAIRATRWSDRSQAFPGLASAPQPGHG